MSGEPFGKQRPKFTTIAGYGRAVTPKKTVDYENLLKLSYMEKYKEMVFEQDEPLKIVIKAYTSVPASVSKKRAALMLVNKIRPTKKPDWDNIGKIVGDALNKIAYPDDKQIVEAMIFKYYDNTPRVEIKITSLEEESGI